MRNRYPGTCYRCGETVLPGDGHFERITRSHRKKWGKRVGEGWQVQHATCAIKYRGTEHRYDAYETQGKAPWQTST